MPDITSIIETLIVNAFMSKQASAPRINKLEWALLILCILCVATGIFFLDVALYQYLESLYTPYIAALISSALVFAAALVAIIINAFLHRKKATNHSSAQDELSEHIHTLIKGVYTELEDPIRENPKTSVIVAALAGLFAARHI
jgi:hypothetical protein